jgi:hypothetical protein
MMIKYKISFVKFLITNVFLGGRNRLLGSKTWSFVNLLHNYNIESRDEAEWV